LFAAASCFSTQLSQRRAGTLQQTATMQAFASVNILIREKKFLCQDKAKQQQKMMDLNTNYTSAFGERVGLIHVTVNTRFQFNQCLE
jgi:hypothetical protein